MEIYESQAEQARHEHAMEALAAELHRSVEEVREVYERAYIDLKSQATIKDYLPVLVARQARAWLRERKHGTLPQPAFAR